MRWTRRACALFALRLAVIAAMVAGFGILLRGLDLGALWAALERARLGLVVAAGVASFVLMWLKAVRFGVLLAPAKRVGMGRLYHYSVLSYAVSTLLPARAGEVLRVWLLVKRDRVPVTAAAGAAATDKLFEALGMLAVVGPLPWLLPGLPAWVSRSLAWVSVAGGVALVAGWVVLRFAREGSRLAWLRPGMEALRRPRAFAAALSLSLLASLLDLGILWMVLRAMGLDLPVGAVILTLLAVNVAIALPTTPAHVGTFELGALLALGLVGVPKAEALAFALVYHAIQAVPLAVIGLVQMRFITATLRAQRLEAGSAGPAEPPGGPPAESGTMGAA